MPETKYPPKTVGDLSPQELAEIICWIQTRLFISNGEWDASKAYTWSPRQDHAFVVHLIEKLADHDLMPG